MSVAHGGARDALKPEHMATILASSQQKGVLEQLMRLFSKNSQDQLSLVPLSASGTEKRQFQPTKNPGQRFLLSSLDGAAIALTRPFLHFRLENKYCAKFTCAFRL